MFATATLVAHRGAQLVSRDALATVEPPAATTSWKPVKHALLVDLMHEELDRRHIRITKEEYAIQREGTSLFAALTLNWLRDEEMSAAIAFRHANDKSEAMNMSPASTCSSATIWRSREMRSSSTAGTPPASMWPRS